VIEASVLPFIALWLASCFALHGRGMNRAATVLTSLVIAIPRWWPMRCCSGSSPKQRADSWFLRDTLHAFFAPVRNARSRVPYGFERHPPCSQRN
jgi:hypothetical protein